MQFTFRNIILSSAFTITRSGSSLTRRSSTGSICSRTSSSSSVRCVMSRNTGMVMPLKINQYTKYYCTTTVVYTSREINVLLLHRSYGFGREDTSFFLLRSIYYFFINEEIKIRNCYFNNIIY